MNRALLRVPQHYCIGNFKKEILIEIYHDRNLKLNPFKCTLPIKNHKSLTKT